LPIGHAAQADARDLKSGLAKIHVVHYFSRVIFNSLFEMQHSFVALEIHCEVVKGDRPAGLPQIESGRRQSINQRWHHVVRQMIQKLCRCVDLLFACRTTGNYDALAALRD